jgi:hypothetical protein
VLYPRSYYFTESGLPAAAGDVTFTVAAKWGFHSRYAGARSCTINGGNACAGNVEGMPKMRVDKNTIDNLGFVTVWTEQIGGKTVECCPSAQATSISDTRWLGTGQLAGCNQGITLSAAEVAGSNGSAGADYSALVTKTTDAGEITEVLITNGGAGYSADPQLVASSAACTCTPQIWTCSSTDRDSTTGSDRTRYSTRTSCASMCWNKDVSAGLCCAPGSSPGSDGGIPVCSPQVALPGNVPGNLDSCIRPLRSGCGGLPVCSRDARSAQENAIRRNYPDMIRQHRKWPHGYSYIQMRGGHDGEEIGNLFLKDYSQYSPLSYYVDTITIPREVFQRSTVDGVFKFTLSTPPGRDGIEIAVMTIGYPVLNEADAAVTSSGNKVDLTAAADEFRHGPAPSFSGAAWSGQEDADMQTQRTETYFQQPYFKGNLS